MFSSIDINLETEAGDTDDIYDCTRRSSLALEDQNASDKKSVDSIMLEV